MVVCIVLFVSGLCVYVYVIVSNNNNHYYYGIISIMTIMLLLVYVYFLLTGSTSSSPLSILLMEMSPFVTCLLCYNCLLFVYVVDFVRCPPS